MQLNNIAFAFFYRQGAFPDDIFALALALELGDIMDIKAVVGTSMDPITSALCMAYHLFIAGRTDVKVYAGKDIHDAPFRSGIWIDENLVGFPLREKCESFLDDAPSEKEVLASIGDMKDLAQMLVKSDRDDWVYISLGGMSTIAALTKDYPEAADKIEDMVVMGTNICGDMMIYTGVMAPVQETNVAVSQGYMLFLCTKIPTGSLTSLASSTYHSAIQLLPTLFSGKRKFH